ncbi:alpha/beta hydrolase [Rhizobium sp. BK418]|uniref:alpha/beta fold hydrolase n=1 Tax=Rhizobium sp. BK418 TaxID=2512120 RepID=UPI0010447351|nr:alpha/beta hydrolase [Rhizobium sp. BK418]TCS09094.1 pimeloyl-ACP methyl ester carboxylesterase [Rhizobium sp. BK418]
MQQRVIETATLRMNITEAGEGPLVLLCHGFPETSHAWRHQISALAEAGFHAVAPDMRGYGRTESPRETGVYTIVDLVADMVALLDALGEEKAVIVGNDWGATVAWQAALMRPDRFRGIVAISVPLMGQPPVPPTKIFPATPDHLLYVLYFQEPGVAEAEFERDVDVTLRKIYSAASGDAGPRLPGDRTPNPFGMVSRASGLLADLPESESLPGWLPQSDLQVFVDAFEESGFRGGLNYYRNLDRNWELQKAFAGRKVEIPALFMTGERDTGLAIPGMREIIAAMPALAPRLRTTQFVPGAGHWLPQEQPETVSRAIVDFMRGLSPV